MSMAVWPEQRTFRSPDTSPASEYGGKVLDNGFQPENPDSRSPNGLLPEGGHELTSSEKLSLIYGTGQEQDPTMDRDAAAFHGYGPRNTWEDGA
jgi:hypothetical protein